MGKVIAAGQMVKSGTMMVMQAAVMIDMMVGAMGSMSKALAQLGPICLGISLGLELLSIALRLYNGDLFTPQPSDFEKTMTAIKAIGSQVDNMGKRLDYLFTTLNDKIEFNLIKNKLIDIIEVINYG